jgi:hypothetical protein
MTPMPETKQLLRATRDRIAPPTDVLGGLGRRRRHKDNVKRASAAALAIVVAIVGLGGWSLLDRDKAPKPVTPKPVLPSQESSWSRVQLDPPIAGGTGPGFLAAGADGLVAVGVREGPVTAWTSSDGATWTRTATRGLDTPVDMNDISSGGPGFIATGRPGTDGAHGAPLMWTSEDGVSWNQLPPDPAFGSTCSQTTELPCAAAGWISAIAPGGPGVVAVGSPMGAWYSSDGSTWARASVPPVPPEVSTGDNGYTPAIDLDDVAGYRGRLVAMGSAGLRNDPNGNHPVVVVWTSRDGRSWTDVPTPAGVFPPGSRIFHLAAGPDGFVAIGDITTGEVSTQAIWSSPDGRDWQLQRLASDGVVLSSVAAGDGGFVAVGATMACYDVAALRRRDCASREAVVMTSVDGETWVRVPSGPQFRVAQPENPRNATGAEMSEVVAWGSRFAALGEYDGKPTVWVSTPVVEKAVATPAPTAPPPAAAAGTLAYILNGDVYLAGPDGSNPVRIADGRPECGDGHGGGGGESFSAEGRMWSPDGRYLAYRSTDCSNPRGWGSRVISDAEGNVLAKFPAQGWQIAWSPDSTRVAVWDTTFGKIGVYGLDGVRLAQLTMPSEWSPSGDHDPEWMPDGASVWVENWDLPVDGSTPRQLPWRGGDPYATYSPDGSLVAYSQGSSLMVARADGSGPRGRRVLRGNIYTYAWSATGDRIAFTTKARGSDSMQVGVVDVAIGTVTLLSEGEPGARLDVIGFSPRGDRILYSTLVGKNGDRVVESSLWSVGVDGSDPRLVVEGRRLVVDGTWEGDWLLR